MKCSRCGLCCKQAPCFLIPIGKEIYNKNGEHVCMNLKVNNGIYSCKLYNKNSAMFKGECSNSKNIKK